MKRLWQGAYIALSRTRVKSRAERVRVRRFRTTYREIMRSHRDAKAVWLGKESDTIGRC